MNDLYRVAIRRDLANPRGYRVEWCYSVSSTTPAPIVCWRARHPSRLFLLSPVPRRPGTVCNPRAILAEYQAARRAPVDARRREAFTAAVSAAEQEYFAAKAHYEARLASAQRRYLAAVTAAKLNYRGILK